MEWVSRLLVSTVFDKVAGFPGMLDYVLILIRVLIHVIQHVSHLVAELGQLPSTTGKVAQLTQVTLGGLLKLLFLIHPMLHSS